MFFCTNLKRMWHVLMKLYVACIVKLPIPVIDAVPNVLVHFLRDDTWKLLGIISQLQNTQSEFSRPISINSFLIASLFSKKKNCHFCSAFCFSRNFLATTVICSSSSCFSASSQVSQKANMVGTSSMSPGPACKLPTSRRLTG